MLDKFKEFIGIDDDYDEYDEEVDEEEEVEKTSEKTYSPSSTYDFSSTMGSDNAKTSTYSSFSNDDSSNNKAR